MMVEVPLIVDVESGVNDMLDRDGSRAPVQFHISNDRNLHPSSAGGAGGDPSGNGSLSSNSIAKLARVFATTCARFERTTSGSRPSAYVDQWDGACDHRRAAQLEFLKRIVGKIWR